MTRASQILLGDRTATTHPCTGRRAVRVRCASLWLLGTALLGGTAVGVLPTASRLPGLVTTADAQHPPTAADLLASVCAVVLLPVLVRLWLAVSLGVADAWGVAGGHAVPRRHGVRGWALAACGVVAVGAFAPAAVAQDAPAEDPLGNLPLPVAPVVPAHGPTAPPSGSAPSLAPHPPGTRATDDAGTGMPAAAARHRSAPPTTAPHPAPGGTGRSRGGVAHRRVRVAPGDSVWRIAAADLGAGTSTAAVARHWRTVLRLNRAALAPDADLVHAGLVLRMPRSAR